MRNPVLPSLMLLFLAAALYLLPDGVFQPWRLRLQGLFVRLEKPAGDQPDASLSVYSTERDLLDILTQKEAEIAQLNRRLRELGVTREAVESVRIIPARVMLLGPDNSLDTYTIDAGTDDGVAPGQAVVVGQSLVGVVVRSEARASLVLSLSSPGCYISARLGRPDEAESRPRLLCAVRGGGAGGVLAIVFSSVSEAQPGWVAMTSGLEKDIPAGLLLGDLAGRFEDGEESGTMEAVLRPRVDLQSVDFVTVLARE